MRSPSTRASQLVLSDSRSISHLCTVMVGLGMEPVLKVPRMKKGKKSTRSTIWDQSSEICCGPFTGGIAISPSRSGERDGILDGTGPYTEVEVGEDGTGDPGEPDGIGKGGTG